MNTMQTPLANNQSISIPDEPYVLVVDDDAAILSVVMLLLETEGYACLGFSDSRTVIPFLEDARKTGQRLPEVMLLDLMMPEVSGYDIAAAIKASEGLKSISIIIMTADHRITCPSDVPGASDWLSKPFRIEVLLDKIALYLPTPCTQ